VEERGWNPLEIAKQWEEEPQIALERERGVQEDVKASQRIEYPGDQTCLVNRPDMSSGTPD
jgi:hypothetical protein